MAFRGVPRVVFAGCLLLGGIVAWRSSRTSTFPVPPPPRRAEAPPSRAAEDAKGRTPGIPDPASVPEPLIPDRDGRAALKRLEPLKGEEAADALLELAGPPWDEDVRLEALKRLGEREWSESRVRKIAALFAAERDDDLRVAMLLSVSSSSLPAVGELAREALKEPAEAIRAMAMTALNPEWPNDRRTLLGLLASDPAERIRGTAALQLSRQASEAEVRVALLSVLLRDSGDETRKHAITALKGEALRGEPAVLDALRRSATQDRSPEVQAHARALLDGLKK